MHVDMPAVDSDDPVETISKERCQYCQKFSLLMHWGLLEVCNRDEYSINGRQRAWVKCSTCGNDNYALVDPTTWGM